MSLIPLCTSRDSSLIAPVISGRSRMQVTSLISVKIACCLMNKLKKVNQSLQIAKKINILRLIFLDKQKNTVNIKHFTRLFVFPQSLYLVWSNKSIHSSIASSPSCPHVPCRFIPSKPLWNQRRTATPVVKLNSSSFQSRCCRWLPLWSEGSNLNGLESSGGESTWVAT